MSIIERKPEGVSDEVWKHIQNLKNENSDVRGSAVEALGGIGGEKLIQTLKSSFFRICYKWKAGLLN